MHSFIRGFLLFSLMFQATLGFCPGSWAEGEDDPLWNRPSFEKKVFNVGQRILAANGITERIQFLSVTRDIRNATASRFGGPNTVVIYKDLLDVMESDDELAAVLSHEIAHITKRHKARTVPRKWAAKTALWTALTVGGTAASLATAGLATPVVLLGAAGIRKMHANGVYVTDPISRPYEKEADLVGLDYMVKAGYNPLAMETLMTKVAGDAGPISSFFASHPGGTDRLTYIHEAIQADYPRFMTDELAQNPLPGSPYVLHAAEKAEKTPSPGDSSKPVITSGAPGAFSTLDTQLAGALSAKASEKVPSIVTAPLASSVSVSAPPILVANASVKPESENTKETVEPSVAETMGKAKPDQPETAKLAEKTVEIAALVTPPARLSYQPKPKALEKPPAKVQMALVPAPKQSVAGNGETQRIKSPEPGESVAHVLLGLQPNHLRILRIISQRGYLSRRELLEQMEYVEQETLILQVRELIDKRLVRLLGAAPDDVFVLSDWASAAF